MNVILKIYYHMLSCNVSFLILILFQYSYCRMFLTFGKPNSFNRDVMYNVNPDYPSLQSKNLWPISTILFDPTTSFSFLTPTFLLFAEMIYPLFCWYFTYSLDIFGTVPAFTHTSIPLVKYNSFSPALAIITPPLIISISEHDNP